MNFYLPVRGNMRRRASSQISENKAPEEESKENIEQEIINIDKHYDFDNPNAIDWALLKVSIQESLIINRKEQICYNKKFHLIVPDMMTT